MTSAEGRYAHPDTRDHGLRSFYRVTLHRTPRARQGAPPDRVLAGFRDGIRRGLVWLHGVPQYHRAVRGHRPRQGRRNAESEITRWWRTQHLDSALDPVWFRAHPGERERVRDNLLLPLRRPLAVSEGGAGACL